ncbi:DNA polymerase [Ceratobasidium sp. AG-Ba]|nr:DNA polymerase [Ceratobasidium sp. AG-Ba]
MSGYSGSYVSHAQLSSIEQWIEQVSNNMPAAPPSHVAGDNSDDEVQIDNTPRGQTNGQGRPQKRTRTNSSPLSESSRVVIERRIPSSSTRRPTPYSPSITRSSTPAGSEFDQSDLDGRSESGSVRTTASLHAKPVNHRDKAKIRRQANDVEFELAATIDRMRSSTSPAYEGFKEPVPDYTSGNPPKKHIFYCMHCPGKVTRQVGVGDTSGLLSHKRRCAAERARMSTLTQHGFSDTTELTEDSVRQMVAQWVCENRRPFSIVTNRWFRRIVHPNARKHLPHRNTIPQDIKALYRATQEDLTQMLKAVPGTLHIGMDMYQSDNGHDYLGVIVFYQEVQKETMKMKRCVLECLDFGSRSHTGKRLAKTMRGIWEKFEIGDRVWGVVGDNAFNNDAMVKRLGGYGFRRFTGLDCRVFCFAHVLNLATQAVAQPFQKPIPRTDDGLDQNNDSDDEIDWESDEHDGKLVRGDDLTNEIDEEHVDDDDLDGEAASWSLDQDGDEDEDDDNESNFDEEIEKRDLPAIVPGSDDDLESKRAARVGRKIAWWAKKLRFCPPLKAIFIAACIESEVETPHNIRRDVITRWNSTGLMYSDAERTFPAILKTQRNPQVSIPEKYQIFERELRHIKNLNKLFQPFKIVTDVVSRADVPLLADVIVHFDSLDYTYGKFCDDTSLPLYIRHAAHRALLVLNKYYGKTDLCSLYQLAVLLHPGMRSAYLRLAKWPEKWIEAAILLAIKIYESCYKPALDSTATATSSATSQFGYSTFAAHLFGTDVVEQNVALCPVREFVNGSMIRPTRDANGNPVLCNPVQWWYSQRVAGNEMEGLTQMALDVLTTPATSVDIERLFSFVGLTVGKRRHKLNSYTIQAAATLGCYSKANMVRPGCLSQLKAAQQGGSKGKAKAG